MSLIETGARSDGGENPLPTPAVLKRGDEIFSAIIKNPGKKHDIRDLSASDQTFCLARIVKNLTHNVERRKAFESLEVNGDVGEWMEPNPAELSTYVVESLLSNQTEVPAHIVAAAMHIMYGVNRPATGALPPVNLITTSFSRQSPGSNSGWLQHRFVLDTFEQPIHCPAQKPESCYAWPRAMDEFARAHNVESGGANDDTILQLLSSHLDAHIVDSIRTRVRYFRLQASPRSELQRNRLLELVEDPETLLTLAQSLIGPANTYPVPLDTVAILIQAAVKNIMPEAVRTEVASEQLKRLMHRKMLRYGYVPHAMAFLEKWFPECEELLSVAEKTPCSATVAFDFYFAGKVPIFPGSANPPLTLSMCRRASSLAAKAILSDQTFVTEALSDHNKTISLAFLLWRHPGLKNDSEGMKVIATEIKGRGERFMINLEAAVAGDHRGPSTWR